MLEGRKDQDYRIAELSRRLANVVRLGTVHSADYQSARVRVQYDETDEGEPVITAWLPWVTTRAGNDRSWWAPEVGEQVVVLSPGGELVNGVVMPAIYQQDHTAPESDPNKHVTVYEDGTRIEYDREAHRLAVKVVGDMALDVDGDVSAAVGGDFAADVGGDAAVKANGDVLVDGSSVVLNGGSAGGVVCQKHVCAFTGSAHPQASGTVKVGD